MPKLWNATIDAHRREVREAVLDTAAELVTAHGLRSVTMSQIADETGIGRATLYKYFPDVEAILRAWHQRQISRHLAQLVDVRDRAGDQAQRLDAVLEAYALIAHQTHRHPDGDFVALVHTSEDLVEPERQLHALFRQLLSDAAACGRVRDDVSADELAKYCLHALAAASSLRSQTAVRRLVTVTLAGLRPPR